MNQMTICFTIFVLTLLGFAFSGKKVSITVVALTGMMAMVLTGSLSAKVALAGFANGSAILMASIFVVAAGFNRTQMVKKLSSQICKISQGSFTKVVAGYVILTCILAQFIPSAVVCFGIVFPMAYNVCEEMQVNPSKIMFSLGLTAISSVITLPLSASISEMARINGFLESFAYTKYNMSILDITYAKFPMMLVVVLLAIFYIPKVAPDVKADQETEVNSKNQEQKELSPFQEAVGYLTFICVIGGLLFSKHLGLANWEITVLGALVIAFTGILDKKEIILSMNLEMVLLYIGSLGLGSALTNTGAADIIGKHLSTMIVMVSNNYIAGFLFFIIPFLLTQCMFNLGVYSIFVPLYIMICKSMGANPVGPIMLCMMGSMTAFLTPMATPTVPLMMGAGNYSQKDLFKMGWLPAVIITIVSVFWVMTVYPVI